MAKGTISFIIDTDGSVTFETHGMKGKKCTEITKQLEEAIGIVEKKTLKSDYYQKDDVHIRMGHK